MAFTEKQEYKVEVIPPYRVLQIRRADIVLKDGVEVGRTYHRHVLFPGDAYSGEAEVVQKIAAAIWDAQTITAYEASLPEPEPEPTPEPEPEPEPTPEPEPEPNPVNMIPDNWTQDQRIQAMQELIQEYAANR